MEGIIEILRNLLLGVVGISLLSIILRFIWIKLGNYVKSTKTNIDQKVFEAIGEIALKVLDEVELGALEKILRKMLKGAKGLPEDTTEIEKAIYKELDGLKKD